jgi:hydrogenase expression/formation protein HypD
MQPNEPFRSPALVEELKNRIAVASTKPLRIMEFCGTHTHAICRYGIREMLPSTIEMFSGPGCPVCVTDQSDMDYAIALAKVPGAIITTFGDLLKVPGSHGSLQDARSEGATVEIVYSPLGALDFAKKHSKRPVIFLGIGFETTAPAIAASILEAETRGLDNFFVYSMHKLTPPAMRAVLAAGEVDLSAILCPGHVSTVIGWRAWRFLPEEHRIPAAVAGFEPVDVLWAIAELVAQHEAGDARIVNAYPRSVTEDGNGAARAVMEKVFEVATGRWRGLGGIAASGLAVREEFARFDAARVFDVDPGETVLPEGCHCGEVIRGVLRPDGCPLFKSMCTPLNPVGPCMVSTEGTCAAYYLYGYTNA